MEWRERVAALEPLGWRGRDAEWVALVCLHSGVFLRGQHLAFLGQTNRSLATRLMKRLAGAAVEEPWNSSGRRVCRIPEEVLPRRVYSRAAGALTRRRAVLRPQAAGGARRGAGDVRAAPVGHELPSGSQNAQDR